MKRSELLFRILIGVCLAGLEGCGTQSSPSRNIPGTPSSPTANSAPATPAPPIPSESTPPPANPSVSPPPASASTAQPPAESQAASNPPQATSPSGQPPATTASTETPSPSPTPGSGTGTERVSGNETFALLGKPQSEEQVNVTLEPVSENVSVSPAPVDSTRFNVEPSPAESNSTASSQNANPRALPKQVTPIPSAGYSADGLPNRITVGENDPVEMVLIPAGNFIRGRNGDAPEFGPEQTVYLDSFYIDQVEVTVERYLTVREASQKAKRVFQPPASEKNGSNFPATGITHADALFYAKWVGKELPTEAQWEKAARGPEGHRFPWGNGRPVWQARRTTTQLNRVGSFPGDASQYGVFDLAGNAREWCRDLYHPAAYRDFSTPEKLRNPIYSRKMSGTLVNVVRGGASDWSAWFRAGEKATARNPAIGFRCVYVPPAREEPAK